MGIGRRTALLAAATTVALTGCGLVGEGEEDEAPTAPTSIDSALLECGDPDGADPTTQLPEIDLTTATWAMPAGFVETFKYSEDLPIEHIESFWAAEPEVDAVPRNVLAVVVYSDLEWGADMDECGRVLVSVIDERLATYQEANGAEALTEMSDLEIAGLPALQQDVGLPEYSYRGYWLFSRHQLIHLYCQWTSDPLKEQVLAGCDELLGSFEVSGA